MFNFIIYSKDRAAQLELLLRSMKQYFLEWGGFEYNILYKCSDDNFKKGYEKLKGIHNECNFKYIEETNFREQTLSFIYERYPYICFFVDDLYFKSSFSILGRSFYKYKHDDTILCLSLRMSPYITRCQIKGIESPPPVLNDDLRWEWREAKGDWSYPMVIDGNIFHTVEIVPLLRSLDYENPSTLEDSLSLNPIDKPYMICCEESVVTNNPINKVQVVNDNNCGDISPEELNDNFLKGKIISFKNLIRRNNDPHQIMTVKYEEIT